MEAEASSLCELTAKLELASDGEEVEVSEGYRDTKCPLFVVSHVDRA